MKSWDSRCSVDTTQHESVHFSPISYFVNILVPDLYSTSNYDCFSAEASLTPNCPVNYATLKELWLFKPRVDVAIVFVKAACINYNEQDFISKTSHSTDNNVELWFGDMKIQ